MSAPKTIALASVSTPWEYLYVTTERGGREIMAEPVIAWGLTESGTVVPVTATGNLQPDKPNALRRVEDGRIFNASGQYPGKEEWLKALREEETAAQAAPTAPEWETGTE